MIERVGVYWADVGRAVGSRPASRRPVLVIQSDSYNGSRLSTVLIAVITSNTTLATMPGNVYLPAVATGLPRESVVNVTALITLNKSDVSAKTGHGLGSLLDDVDRGLRRVLKV